MADAKADAKKGKLVKGRHRSAIKRHRQSVKRYERNLGAHTQLKTVTKKVKAAVQMKDVALAGEALKKAMAAFSKAAAHGIIHKKNASRHVSRLSILVRKLAA